MDFNFVSSTLKLRMMAAFSAICLVAITSTAIATSPAGTPARSCSEDTSKISGEGSVNLAKFKRLASLGNKAPISEFLILWYPERDSKLDGAYFFKCQPEPWDMIDKKDGIIPAQCSPDLLYSWGKLAKLETLKGAWSNGKPWSGPANPGKHVTRSSYLQGALFTTLSPVSTFSYGEIPVRLKLRKTTPISDRTLTDPVSRHAIPDPDAVHNFMGNIDDFTVSDFRVVESWSFGTPEHYDEIIKDIRRISSGKRATGYLRKEPAGQGLERVFNAGIAEYGDQDETTLKRNLWTLIKMILNREGQIHFREGSCQNRSLHFQDVKPTYFNQ